MYSNCVNNVYGNILCYYLSLKCNIELVLESNRCFSQKTKRYTISNASVIHPPLRLNFLVPKDLYHVLKPNHKTGSSYDALRITSLSRIVNNSKKITEVAKLQCNEKSKMTRNNELTRQFTYQKQ